jgi:hypothetical protein
MKALRHPATAIASLALFLGLRGGAALASGLISGSQIKNHSIPAKKLTRSAIKSLHGARGSAGATGPAGAAGAPGPRGPIGPTEPQSRAELFGNDHRCSGEAAAAALGRAEDVR